MFAILKCRVYDAVESVYGCLDNGQFYCKYGDKTYHLIETNEEKTYLMNNIQEIHEMIHITDSYTEVIYHDRYGDGFVTLIIDPSTFNHIEHMNAVDFLFVYNESTQSLDDSFHLSHKHINLLNNNSYKIGAFE